MRLFSPSPTAYQFVRDPSKLNLLFRFSPAIFFYLLAALPAIWLLELRLMELRHQASDVIANRTNVDGDSELFGVSK